MSGKNHDYDLFVIGAGSGGVRAARVSAELGARVAIAEEYRVGGTCVIRGCVPKKLMTYAAHYREDFADAVGYGWDEAAPSFDWSRFIAAKDREIDRLNGLYRKTLEKHGVTLFESRATLEDAHRVRVGDRTVSAETILIATGGAPHFPDTPGIEHAISSNEVFHLDALPRHIVIVGGGYIAVEFAGIFHGLGAKVTLVYRGERILRGFDGDLRRHLEDSMRAQGIDILCEEDIAEISKTGAGLTATLKSGGRLDCDRILYATGRRPNTKGLGLEKAGVRLAQNGAIPVDEFSRTEVENIYAVGDVTDRVALTPVAIKEGHAFALTRFGGREVSPDHRDVASAVFSSPPIGTVGLSEEEAKQKYDKADIYVSDFKPMKNTLSGREQRALTKIVVDPESDRVLGMHMIGPDAPEIIQGFAVALKMGLRKADLDRTVAIHPTSAEEFVLMSTRRG